MAKSKTKTNEPLIKIVGVKKYFPLKKTKLFQRETLSVKANDGINLVIHKGETLGLVGESGCGKSTLGRVLLQLYPLTEGKIIYYGYNVDEYAPKYFIREIKKLKSHKIQYLKIQEKIPVVEENIKQMKSDPAVIEKIKNYEENIKLLTKENEDLVVECKKKHGAFIISDNIKAVRKSKKLDAKVAESEALIAKLEEQVKKLNVDLQNAKQVSNPQAEAEVSDLEAQLAKATLNEIADINKKLAIAKRKANEHIINVDLKIRETQKEINIAKSDMANYVKSIKSSMDKQIELNTEILIDMISYKERHYTNQQKIKKLSELAALKSEYDKIEKLKAKKKNLLDRTSIAVGALILSEDIEMVQKHLLNYIDYQSKAKIEEDNLELLKVKKFKLENQLAEEIDKKEIEIKVLKQKLEDVIAKISEVENKLNEFNQAADKEKESLLELKKELQDHDLYDQLEANRETGLDLSRLSGEEMRKLRKDLQLIFQDPYSSLNPRMTVGQIINEGMRAHNLEKYFYGSRQDEIIRVMEKCGLAPYMLHRYPHQFSGGQRQRIGIARALALDPKFVVCDEAVSALDVSIQSQIINLLEDLRDEENLTYLFISHDLSVIKHISDRIGVMYLGKIVELAESDAIYNNPLHPYTKALISSIPTTDQRGVKRIILEGDIPSNVFPPSGCKFRTRCPLAREACAKKVPEFREVEPGRFVACHFYEETKTLKTN